MKEYHVMIKKDRMIFFDSQKRLDEVKQALNERKDDECLFLSCKLKIFIKIDEEYWIEIE